MTTRGVREDDQQGDPGASDGRPRRHQALGFALAALAAACWAAGGLMAKWLFTAGADPVQPVHLAAARALVSAGLLAVCLALVRRDALRVRVRDLPFLAAFGVFGLAAMHVAYFTAIERSNVPTAILLEYLAPVLVLTFSVAFLGHRPTWMLPLGVALSVVGCALVVGVIGGGGLRVSAAGVAWGLAAAVFFAAYILMGERAAGVLSPWTLLFYGLVAASAFWLVYLGVRGELGHVAALLTSPDRAGVVLAIATVATVVPFAAFLASMTHIDATRASITATLEPVIAAAATYAIPALHASLSPLQLLGGALVLAACVIVQVSDRSETALPPPA